MAIAISGGADSVALAWILRELAGRGTPRFELAGFVHVHHGLRGEEADRDERFCRELAARVDRPIEVARVDVAARAAASRRSIEAEARDARYACFADAARVLRASVVATGHTLDDQAETVLMRLLRGSATRGVAGIRSRRGPFIRPLLDCRRAHLRAWLDARGERWCEDSSNEDRGITRNLIRHELLPAVERVAEGALPALARYAALAAADESYLNGQATEVGRSIVLKREDAIDIDRQGLAAVPDALGRRVVRAALEAAGAGSRVTSRHVGAVWAIAAAGRASGVLALPAVGVTWTPGWISLAPARREAERLAFACTLPVPGAVQIEQAGLTMTSVWLPGDTVVIAPPGRADAALLRADTLVWPLTVRSRQPGDRIRPLGAPGRRKVQDLFVDHKVPRAERDAVPIVADATGRIVWVVGHAVAEECRVPGPAAGVVLLKVDRSPRDDR